VVIEDVICCVELSRPFFSFQAKHDVELEVLEMITSFYKIFLTIKVTGFNGVAAE